MRTSIAKKGGDRPGCRSVQRHQGTADLTGGGGDSEEERAAAGTLGTEVARAACGVGGDGGAGDRRLVRRILPQEPAAATKEALAAVEGTVNGNCSRGGGFPRGLEQLWRNLAGMSPIATSKASGIDRRQKKSPNGIRCSHAAATWVSLWVAAGEDGRLGSAKEKVAGSLTLPDLVWNGQNRRYRR